MKTERRSTGLSRRRRRRWTRDQIQVTDPAVTRRSIKGASIGNFMEWYDFGVYGYIATTIAQVFYPGNTASAVHLIATFSTLAAAFVVRPLGGIIFGPLGDRIGRKRVLMITIVLMTVGTTATGLLPGYSTIGIWAPILLVVARVFQGLSTGGEYVGAMTYVVEQAPDRKRGMVVGFLPMGNLSGFVLAGLMVTGLQTLLSSHDMLTWGWRIPLLLSAPFGLIALYMRLRLDESAAYEKAHAAEDASEEHDRNQLRRTVVNQWKPMLICAALVLTSTEADYMLTGYLPTYLKVVVHLGHTAGLVMITITLTILMLLLVLVAMLSDRIGVKPIMWTGCGLLIAASIPAFLLIRSGRGYPVIFIGVLLIGLMELCFDSTSPSALPALFPTEVRYGALAIAYNISISAVGGTTPLIAQALVSGTGNAMVPAYMLIFAGLVGAVTLLFTPEMAGKRLPGSGPSVETEQEARELAADIE
ncbi:MAG: transporter, family, proline/betaine transporter [Mycobacterium sp.]|jgi:MHS family proline/betaine transporter-like MFS transporter|nr:transporter, family, proline/betaine transporter [Mycobacterium sp.]MDT5166992.1 transporter, family, proline/betaine transporter [Mycobacterium sp.]